ncbi:ABC transporter permease [Amycolatopsis tolypomycina]|uniref:ABC transporter permease n=1 Tax=Amycolatopsis tolypomycina TaxID=208445 RepID=UPI0033AF9831
MNAALWAEFLKARRSRLPWVTVLAFTIAAAFGGLIMFILQDLGRARALGLLGTKAAIAGGSADWPAYFTLLAQTVAVGGFLIFGLVVVWLFGREFGQGTAKDLLALPTARATIVAAKFAVTALWCLLLTLQTFVLGLAIGSAIGLTGWSPAVAGAGLAKLLLVATMTVVLTTPLALAASAGRGYLAAVGVMFAVMFLSQVIALLGYGAFFPWSVPALFTGLAGPEHAGPGPIGYGLVGLTGVAGAFGTGLWWRYAEQAG